MARTLIRAHTVLTQSPVLGAIRSGAIVVENGVIRRIGSLEALEAARSDPADAPDGVRWILRSGHFVFGMPRLIDNRHDFAPEGFSEEQTGITVIAREGFVVAHFDRMKSRSG